MTRAASGARRDPGRVLLVGGGGFLGRQTADYLTDAGCEVHVLDRAPRPHESALTSPSHYYSGSVTNPHDVDEAFAASRPDCVITMASYSNRGLGLLRAAEQNPAGAVQVNVTGLINVLDAAARARTSQALWLSSTTVYGPAAAYLTDADEESLLLPASVYGATKVMGEQLVRNYRATHHLVATAVRPTLVWGPGLQYRGIQSPLDDTIRAAATGEPVAVARSEEPWDLLYVRDAGRVLAWLTGRDMGPVVLVNGYRASLDQLRDTVLALAPETILEPGTDAPVIDLPPVDDDKIRRAGFRPDFDLRASVLDYIAHLRGD